MYYVIFILIALLAGLGIFVGWTKATLWAFLLGTGLVTLLGVVALNEGLNLGQNIVYDVDGEVITAISQTLIAQNDVSVFIIGHVMLYGGIVLSSLGLVIAVIPFYNIAKQYQ